MIHPSKIALLAITLLAATPAGAAVFNIAPGFNPASNAVTDLWTYLEGPGYGSYTLLPNQAPYIVNTPAPFTTFGWNNPANLNSVPAFFAHTGGGTWSVNPCCGVVPLPNNTLVYHPGMGPAGGLSADRAVLRFTVPAQANGSSYQSAKIKFKYTDLDRHGGDGIRWSIDHNGASQANGTLFSLTTGPLATTGTQFAGFSVTTGDTIDFVLDPIADENFDTTGLTGSITLN